MGIIVVNGNNGLDSKYFAVLPSVTMNEMTKPETGNPRAAIRGLKPLESYIFRGYSQPSISAVVSKVKAEYAHEGREYHCKTIPGGVQVWRLT